jgi:gliding motility-associated-like protein
LVSCDPVSNIKAKPPTAGRGQWVVVSGNAEVVKPDQASTQVQVSNAGGIVKITWQVLNTGCPTASDTLTIVPFQLRAKDIANVITPNGDGKNDAWRISNLSNITNTLEIFNRWGEPVFGPLPYKNGWNGASLSAGVYYYLITVPSCRQTVKGTLTILD